MSKVAPSTDSAWLVCPHCSTVSQSGRAACDYCESPLDWLGASEDFRRVLAADNPGWSFELHLDAEWPGGEAQLRKPADAPIEISTGDGDPWCFRLPETDLPLEARRGGDVRQMTLPGKMRLGDLHVAARLAAAPQARGSATDVLDFAPTVISLDAPGGVVLGSEISEDVHEIADSSVELRHCIIIRQSDPGHYWIADLNTSSGTFINRCSIAVARLGGGDFVQIGKRAWIFNESDGLLVPVAPIEGSDLRLQGVALRDRLAELDLAVPPGQLVAIAGASGAGKSTLIHAVLAAPHSRTQGSLSAGGYDSDRNREAYRRRFGYVSQKDVVHGDLKAQEAIDFGARLRERPASRKQVQDLLRRLDLRADLWDKRPCEMSGGEAQRVRIAAELVSGPELLLLDEPAKGLDQGREIALMTLLRGLSYQGCTVIVVTHGLRHLEFFDRALIFQKSAEGGRLKFDGTPEQLRDRIPSGDFGDLDLSDPPEQLSAAGLQPAVPSHSDEALSTTIRDAWERGSRQLGVLFWRELAIAWNARVRRAALPLLVVPLIFAASISVAVPTADRDLLGFFAVLASIWMGSSLSLLSIVSERTVLDHECLIFLRLTPYLAAKCAVLWLFSMVQTVLFVVLLSLFRAVSHEDGMLYYVGWAAVYLTLVGWAAVGMGLVISAVSGSRAVVANFLLPLLMMVQIVFSVQVAGDGDEAVDQAYSEFSTFACQGRNGCPRRVEHRLPQTGTFLCGKCRKKLRTPEDDQWAESLAELREAPVDESREQVATDNQKLPNAWAAYASAFTLSRYGDMALRCFAYRKVGVDDFQANGYARWRNHAIARLVLMTLGLPLVSLAILWWQTSGKSYYIHEIVRLLLAGRHGEAKEAVLEVGAKLRSTLARLSRSGEQPRICE